MNKGISLFNKSITDTLVVNKKYLSKYPNYLLKYAKIASKIKSQTKVRNSLYKNEKLTVPPILIISITDDCNLSCSGCYACNKKSDTSIELNINDIEKIIDEAVKLGVSMIFIAGGEPLMKDGILDIPQKYKEIVFVIFSNGLLFSEKVISKIKSNKNAIPVISLEGNKESTDSRRGTGVYDSVINTLQEFKHKKIMFGASITLTRENYDEVINTQYLADLENMGSAVTFLIEYVPQNSEDTLYLEEEQKYDLNNRDTSFIDKYNMLVITLPGDEQMYDGCLAAGRGFIHISSSGSLEACPFAPYSDINIKDISLKEALKSKLLSEIREHHDELKETKGGCALNENKEWVRKLIQKYK